MNEEYQTRQFFNNNKVNNIHKKVKKVAKKDAELKPVKLINKIK
jgi:hypothetical protein